MTMLELRVPIAVYVVSDTLPDGVKAESRKGTCIAWWMTEEVCLWLVCFDETGELVFAPMSEIRMRPNWSVGRRYSRPAA